MKDFQGNELAVQIYEAIKPFTYFAAILLETQIKKLGKDPMTLLPTDVMPLANAVERAITTFATPDKGTAAKQKITELLKSK